jgi:hypothetical protein
VVRLTVVGQSRAKPPNKGKREVEVEEKRAEGQTGRRTAMNAVAVRVRERPRRTNALGRIAAAM